MILHKLEVKNLHDNINLDVEFKKDVNLLVGINGCGKTSILNVIDWLLRPNLKRLAAASYSSLTLSFNHNNKEYILSAIKEKSKLALHVINIGHDPKLEPIIIELISSKGLDDDEIDNLYEGLHPEKHEVATWEFLKTLNTPIIITLDRTISAEVEEIVFIENNSGGIQRRIRSKSRVRNPLSHVQEVTSDKFAEYRKNEIQNDNELKAQIIMSALQNPLDRFNKNLNENFSSKSMKSINIEALEKKVIEYLSKAIKTENIEQQIKSFFRVSRETMSFISSQRVFGKGQEDILLEFIFSQYKQIDSLAKAFNTFERKNENAFKELKQYLEVINNFFKDSGKSVYFDESTGKLVFSFMGREKEKRSIQYLSSGEKQILILFTFLAFVSESGSVFIVDEPELSLHPKWQYEFMEAFLRLKPKNTQLLLATHSPEIVGKFKSSCILLQGVNNA